MKQILTYLCLAPAIVSCVGMTLMMIVLLAMLVYMACELTFGYSNSMFETVLIMVADQLNVITDQHLMFAIVVSCVGILLAAVINAADVDNALHTGENL